MPLYVGGRRGAPIKELVCKGTVWWLAPRGPQAGLVLLAQGRQACRAACADGEGTGPVTGGDEHAERFTLLRPLLFTIVYEILGSATESDDVLQDSYLRWAEVDLATVRDTKSYLARLVTRQALNALRAGARRREDYVGPWLPEPLLLDEHDASADVVLAESVSMAMLVLLETLTPRRARGVRAARGVRLRLRRDRRGGRQIRGDGAPDGAPRPRARAGPTQAVRARRRRRGRREITEQFMAAAATGDMEGLLSMLAPDVRPGPPTAAARPARPAGRWWAPRRWPG